MFQCRYVKTIMTDVFAFTQFVYHYFPGFFAVGDKVLSYSS